jgi:hypothetical protein
MSGEAFQRRTLEIEARVLGHCLVGRIPSPALIDRYCEANRELVSESAATCEAALLRFVRKHPWSASFLDAACALLRPDGAFRTKMLIMAAVLETSTEFAEEFLPRTTDPFRLTLSLMRHGLVAVIRTLAGLVVYPLAKLS